MIRFVLAALGLAGLAAGRATAQEAAKDVRPNILFILVDDLGWMDIGANNPDCFYDTPGIDQLAARSLRFTSGYAACPVCSPTRASILTGRYPQRVGITDYINPAGGNQPERWRRNTRLLPAPYRDRLGLEELTLAETLKRAGYATFFAGKWHLGPQGWWPEDQGFDVNKGGIERGGPYGGKKYFSPYGNPRLEDGPEGEHLPARLADETVRFIEAHRDEPFFAYLSFYSVHTPLMARADLKQKYEKRAKALPPDRERWGREGERKVRLLQDHAVYAGMVEAMDQAVGRVLRKLEELGLEEHTAVFFTSDNGGLSTSEGHPTSNFPLRAGKGWLYEGGIREPLLVRWPGVTKAGATCSKAVISTDFYPTILEIAGLEMQGDPRLDGTSLVPLLRGGERLTREALYWHYPHYGNQGGAPGGAVRAGRWKLIEWYEGDRAELYDLESDLGEKHDLAASHPEKVKELREKLAAWRREVGARMPSANPAFHAKGDGK